LTIERTRTEFLKTTDREMTQRILDLLADRRAESRVANRLVIKAAGRVVFLDLEEIDWVEAAANYVKLHVGKESYLLREAIGHISQRLDPDLFLRVHRSTIVNVRRIKELQPCNSGEYILVLKDGKELSCSRGYRTGLHQLIEDV
jgi:two-component system LytT family response regulator